MKSIVQTGSRHIFRSALVVKKHGPTIAFAGGIAGVVTSTVMACRATLKLSEKLPEMKDELDDIRRVSANSDEDHRKDVAYVYTKNAMIVAQLYGPSVIIGVASITALTGSHITLNRRNAGLTAGYAALSKAYDEYRERVREEMGEDKERDLYLGIYEEKHKNGEGKKEVVRLADPNALSPYARFFDEYSTRWEKNAEINFIFLKVAQEYFTNILHSRGHVFLNEVYAHLGFEHTGPGAVVGWIVNEEGDNYVDFGLYSVRNSEFVNGLERSVLLDFNVNGVIYDKI